MENNTEKNTSRYVANDMESYLSLAQFICISPLVQSTLFPSDKTIVIAYGNELGVLEAVNQHINDNALNFRTAPIEDANEDFLYDKRLDPKSLEGVIVSLTRKGQLDTSKIQDLEKELDGAKEETVKYQSWWIESTAMHKRVESQLSAIMTLIEGIIRK